MRRRGACPGEGSRGSYCMVDPPLSSIHLCLIRRCGRLNAVRRLGNMAARVQCREQGEKKINWNKNYADALRPSFSSLNPCGGLQLKADLLLHLDKRRGHRYERPSRASAALSEYDASAGNQPDMSGAEPALLSGRAGFQRLRVQARLAD